MSNLGKNIVTFLPPITVLLFGFSISLDCSAYTGDCEQQNATTSLKNSANRCSRWAKMCNCILRPSKLIKMLHEQPNGFLLPSVKNGEITITLSKISNIKLRSITVSSFVPPKANIASTQTFSTRQFITCQLITINTC